MSVSFPVPQASPLSIKRFLSSELIEQAVPKDFERSLCQSNRVHPLPDHWQRLPPTVVLWSRDDIRSGANV